MQSIAIGSIKQLAIALRQRLKIAIYQKMILYSLIIRIFLSKVMLERPH